MAATPGKDALEEGYKRLAKDPQYQLDRSERRIFTQADLDAAFKRGYREGYDNCKNQVHTIRPYYE